MNVKKNSPRLTCGLCRVCRKEQPVSQKDWHHASRPRCTYCGGMLDRRGWWTAKATNHACEASGVSLIYKKTASEFEVQAYLYHELMQLGFDVRGEVPTTSGKERFDLVIFDSSQKPIEIIEVKKDNGFKDVQQSQKYRKYGIPVSTVIGMKQAEQFICQAENRSPMKFVNAAA